jgi:hypothetical protein
MTGGPMPYVLDTGPYFLVLEDRLNDPAKRGSILKDLRNDKIALSTISGLDSTTLAEDRKTPDQRVAILNRLWFGMELVAGAWVKQPNKFPTGFWNGFQGDTEAILRAGLIRAIEVSLGINHGVDPNLGTRQWPIEVTWVCQGPFFQCWVTWMKSSSGDGHVSLTIATPAAEGLKVKAKITRTTVKPDYANPPPHNAFTTKRGMWVIGHEDYVPIPTFSTFGTGRTAILIPGIGYTPVNPKEVICVAPAEWEGGVLGDGRRYTAPRP